MIKVEKIFGKVEENAEDAILSGLEFGSETREKEFDNWKKTQDVKTDRLAIAEKLVVDLFGAYLTYKASIVGANILKEIFINGAEIEKLDQFLTPSMRNFTKEVPSHLFRKIFSK